MNDNTLQEIKDRLNIADVISGYIPVKKAGVNFKAACPFHHEKSPSLVISPAKQIWHCFGCGEGGDVFGFVMKYENLEFKEALKVLADKAGVKLPAYKPEDKAQTDEKEILFRINNFAARYYHQVLMSRQGAEALEYLKNRGLNEATIRNWQIGFAPDDFHALERALAAKKVSAAELVKAGVSAKNERGQMYDRFRGRITFPIYNYFGETVGFSARLLKDSPNAALLRQGYAGQAKYVNSPETSIYNKGKTLFGLNFAKEAIRKKDEVVIVEGQMDCIAAHQAGFNNAVASSGTALTEAGLQQLGRLTKNLKFCFDTDTAGQAATRRAGEMALKLGFKAKLIILTAVKDPDELILIKKSPHLWEKAVSEAVWFLDYYINLAEVSYPPGSVEQKHYLSKEVVPFLQFIRDPLELDHYIHKMATKFLISEKVIRDQVKLANQQIGKPTNQLNGQKAAPGLLLQKEVLGGLLFLPEFANEIRGKVEKDDFEDPQISQIVEVWLNPDEYAGAAKPAEAGISDFSKASSDDPLLYSPTEVGEKRSGIKHGVVAKEAMFMVESQLEELAGDTQKLHKSLSKSFVLLKLSALKRKQQQLQAEIKAAENSSNKTALQELNKKFALIISQRLELEKNV